MDTGKKPTKQAKSLKEIQIPSVAELIDIPEAIMSSIDKDIHDELDEFAKENQETPEDLLEDEFEDLPDGDDFPNESDEDSFYGENNDSALNESGVETGTIGAEMFLSILSSPEKRAVAERLSMIRQDFLAQKKAMEASLPKNISLDAVYEMVQKEAFDALRAPQSEKTYSVEKPVQQITPAVSPREDIIQFLKSNAGLMINILTPEGTMSSVSYEFMGGNEEFLLLGIDPELASESSFHAGSGQDLNKKSANASMPETVFVVPFSSLSRGFMLSERVSLVDGYHPQSKKVTPEKAIEPAVKEEQVEMNDQSQEVYQKLVNLALSDADRFFSVCKKHNISLASAMACMKSHGFVYSQDARSFVQMSMDARSVQGRAEKAQQIPTKREVPDGYASSIAQLANSLRK